MRSLMWGFALSGFICTGICAEDTALDSSALTEESKTVSSETANQNSDLYRQWVEKRTQLQNLSVEERKAAMQEWMQSKPQLQETLQSGQGMAGRMNQKVQSFQNENPELYTKFQELQTSIKDLSVEEKKAKIQEFISANPQVQTWMQNAAGQFQGRRMQQGMPGMGQGRGMMGLMGQNLQNTNPELYSQIQNLRENMQGLSPKERREKMQEFVNSNPELQNLGMGQGRRMQQGMPGMGAGMGQMMNQSTQNSQGSMSEQGNMKQQNKVPGFFGRKGKGFRNQ